MMPIARPSLGTYRSELTEEIDLRAICGFQRADTDARSGGDGNEPFQEVLLGARSHTDRCFQLKSYISSLQARRSSSHRAGRVLLLIRALAVNPQDLRKRGSVSRVCN